MQRDTETAFLAARAEAHASRIGVSTFAHAALCGCQRADTYCDRCDRPDFENPADTLVFTGASWTCLDCCEELAASADEAIVDDMLLPFCVCGRRWSQCDGSRRGCHTNHQSRGL